MISCFEARIASFEITLVSHISSLPNICGGFYMKHGIIKIRTDNKGRIPGLISLGVPYASRLMLCTSGGRLYLALDDLFDAFQKEVPSPWNILCTCSMDTQGRILFPRDVRELIETHIQNLNDMYLRSINNAYLIFLHQYEVEDLLIWGASR